MTNSEARKRHATPPTPDALDAIRARLAEVEAHRDLLLKGFFASCPDAHKHGVWCGSAWVAMEARATAAESARDAAEGAIERVRAWAQEYVGQWHPNWKPETFTFDMGVGAAAHDVLAALAPVTADEVEGGGE